MALVLSFKLRTLFQDVFVGKGVGESKVSGCAGLNGESMAECDAQPILMTLFKVNEGIRNRRYLL